MEPAHWPEQQILERYLAGQLTVEEVAEFEEHLLENPELVAHLEAARKLKLGLRTLSQRGTLSSLLDARRNHTARWLMAAGVAAAVVGTALLTLRPVSVNLIVASLRELPETLRGKQLAGEYILVRTRGEPVEITLPKTPAPIAVSMEVPHGIKSPNYSVALVCGGKTLSTANDLRVNPDDMVVVFVDPSTLDAGPCDFVANNGAETRAVPVLFTLAED
jgi:hypothetical protein